MNPIRILLTDAWSGIRFCLYWLSDFAGVLLTTAVIAIARAVYRVRPDDEDELG